MIDGITNADAIPVLERMLQFTARRQELIAHNIANIDTPGFRPQDVSIKQFQAQLGDAVDRRRGTFGSGGGPLQLASSREIEVGPHGLVLHPKAAAHNILFHDGSDRDLERMAQALVENFVMFRTAAELLRNRFELINTAIRGRI